MSILRFMKKLFLFVAVMITAVSFSSCSKDDDNGNTTPKEMRYVKEITFNYDFSIVKSIRFEYDDQHRVVKYESSTDGSEPRTFPVTYNGKNVQIRELNSSYITTTLKLNDAGNVIFAEEIERGSQWSYEYDTAGRLISEQCENQSPYEHYTYRWENGNRYATSNSYEPNPPVIIYTNLKTPPCNFDFTNGIRLSYEDFCAGLQNANLLESSTCYYESGSYEGRKYAYEFNQDGYISRIKETWYYAGEDDEVTTYDITYC